MSNYTVYMHISPSNKRYIGITKRKPKHRWHSDGSGYKDNQHFWSAINKYGWDNFKHIIIARGLDEETAKWLEIELIREWNSTNQDKGYNLSLGGESWNCSEETRKKISERNIRLGIFKGENNPMYGKIGKNSPTSKQIIMFDLKGNIVKEFDCIREANDYFNKNRAFSLISRTCIAKKGIAYGHLFLFKVDYEELILNNTFREWLKYNEELYKKNNIRANTEYENKNRKVYQLQLKTYEIIKEYNSCYDASIELGLKRTSAIYNVAVHRENRNTVGGYHWIFVDEYENMTKEEIANIYINKCTTEDVRKKISESRKGKYLGKNNGNSKSIICLTTKRIFYSIKEGAEYYGIKGNSHISKCCKGELKSCGKLEDGTPLVWKYITIVEL